MSNDRHDSAPATWIARANENLATANADAAIKAARQAIAGDPNNAEAHHTLAAALQLSGNVPAAHDEFQRAADLDPGYISARANLGLTHYVLGRPSAARESFATALALDPNYPPALIGSAISWLEPIYSDREHVIAARTGYRESLQRAIQRLANAPVAQMLSAAEMIPLLPNFYLAYQGENDRELQELYGSFVARVCTVAHPAFAGAVASPEPTVGERIRVGFLSAFFRNHSNWKIPIRGWVESLDRSRFELFGYHVDQKTDATTTEARSAFDHWHDNVRGIGNWAETIRADRLHALIIPEIGMNGPTLQLAALRLAPVQATSWGHPQTSGLPTIDYFLSSDAMEPENAASHYSETLVRLPNLSIHYTPPPYTPADVARKELGVDRSAVLYWCCQSLQKYLPEHDDVFPRIAGQVANCTFLFIEGGQPEVTARMRARLHAAFERSGLDADRHCRFIPKMTPDRFAGVTRLTDIFLDSIGWSGCNSTLEAIAQDVPVVTTPGGTMRSRHTAAILGQLGMSDLIATDKDSFVHMAIDLGNDPAARAEISQRVAKEKHRLYRDETPVRALEEFLTDAVRNTHETGAKRSDTDLRTARTLQQSGRLADAEDAYRRILAATPGHPDALHGLGVLALQQGRYERACDILDDLVKQHPQSAESWIALAEAHKALDRRAEALTCYERAIAGRPGYAPAHQFAARTALQIDQPHEALPHAQRAVELAPDDAAAYADLGLVAQTLEDYEQAAAAYRRGLALANPRYAAAVEKAGPSVTETIDGTSELSTAVGRDSYPLIPPMDDTGPRPFWSVVIPAYTRRLYLLQCLASVLAAWGGPEDMEIVVVDNGSDPPLKDLVDSVGLGIVRYVYHPQTIPLQANWNSAVRAARGQWIHLLHDDDYVLPGFYQTLRHRLQTCPDRVGAGFTGYQNIDVHGIVKLTKQPYGPKAGIAADWLDIIGVGNALNPPAMVIKRDAYERLGGYSEEILYTIDWELYMRVASFFDWWYEPAPLVHYRVHPESVTKQENEAGGQGYSFRRAIEMAEGYMPAAKRDAITARARVNNFEWCVSRLAAPLGVGNVAGAIELSQEALRIEDSDRANLRLFSEATNSYARDLKEAIASTYRQDAAGTAEQLNAEDLFSRLVSPESSDLRASVRAALLRVPPPAREPA